MIMLLLLVGLLIASVAGYEGQVFVCTNKFCREKGGDTTLASFRFLTPPTVPIYPVNCLGRCNKGPNCRIFTTKGEFVDASAVRSVEKIVDLLQTHLNTDININSASVLKLNYEGNVYLRSGKVDRAIECYSEALGLRDKSQEGVLLAMRGTAFLQRAYDYKMRYSDLLAACAGLLPDSDAVLRFLQAVSTWPGRLRYNLVMQLFAKMRQDYKQLENCSNWTEIKARWNEGREGEMCTTGKEFTQKGAFLQALQEHTLFLALQDLLSATLILPGFAQEWLLCVSVCTGLAQSWRRAQRDVDVRERGGVLCSSDALRAFLARAAGAHCGALGTAATVVGAPFHS